MPPPPPPPAVPAALAAALHLHNILLLHQPASLTASRPILARRRFRDVEAEAAAAAAALGPVQQSAGADLAKLLSQAEPFDRGFYYRCSNPDECMLA